MRAFGLRIVGWISFFGVSTVLIRRLQISEPLANSVDGFNEVMARTGRAVNSPTRARRPNIISYR